MSDLTKMQYCSGCRNNFYNGRQNIGGNTCWSLKDAEVVKRVFIHRDAPPPYKGLEPRATLKCWYGDTGMRTYDPSTFTAEGYWK